MGFPLGIFGGVLKGRNRYDIDSAIGIFTLVLRTVLLVVFLNSGYKIVAVALITLSANLIGFILRALFSLRIINRNVLKTLKFDSKYVKIVLKYSSFVFISNIAIRIIYYTDSLVIGTFVSAAAITFYSIGGRLVEYFRELIAMAANVVMPIASGA